MSFCLGCLVFPHDSIQVMPLWWDYHRSDAGFSLHRVRQSTVLTCPVTADTHLIKVVSASLLHCRSNSFLFSLFLYLTTFSNSEKPGSFFLNIFIPSIPRYIANFPPPLSYSTFSTIYVWHLALIHRVVQKASSSSLDSDSYLDLLPYVNTDALLTLLGLWHFYLDAVATSSATWAWATNYLAQPNSVALGLACLEREQMGQDSRRKGKGE